MRLTTRAGCSAAIVACILVEAAAAASPAIFQISQSQWAALNQSVSGRLAIGTPLGFPCYGKYENGTGNTVSEQSNYNTCNTASNNKANSQFLTAQFGGYQTYQYGTCMTSGAACPLDGWTQAFGTCHQGSVPNYYINVQTPSDVAAGLAFARQNKVPLVVKNTGHDYKGRSAIPASLALWTHNVQPAIRLDKNFVPDGCSQSVGPTLTYGAGQRFDGIYQAAHANGYMAVGGVCGTVGASGGWVTGAGHSPLSPYYGLGVDNAMQMRVVLPNGTYVTANRCQNQDIFFALRGGGGGTFGVIMETTSRVYPEVPLQMANIAVAGGGSSAMDQLTDIFVQNAASWSTQGWGGFMAPSYNGGAALALTMVTPKLTLAQAQASLKPLTDYAHAWGSFAVVLNITTVPSYYDYHIDSNTQELSNTGVGDALIFSSRLVPKDNFQGTKQAKLSATLKAMLHNGTIGWQAWLTAPSQYQVPASDQPNGPGYASISPAWRNSYWHLTMTASWGPTDSNYGGYGSPAGAYRAVSNAINPLRQITPTSGAYQNEADTYEPNVASSFWGATNYARLLKIKNQLDPDNILTCHQCVGWNPSDPRFGCYPQL